VNQRRQRARAASHEAWTADFSEPRSRSRCCLSAQRWPLITYGEEASPRSHFDSSNIQPAAVATGSILASANALAAADSGRPPHRAASLSRVAIELRQPIRLNLRRTSGASRYRPFRDLRISSRAARRPAARPASQAPPHLNGTSTSTQRRTSDSRAPPRAPTSRPSRCLACCDGMRVLSCTHYVGAREHSLRRGCCPSVAAHGLRRRLLPRRLGRCTAAATARTRRPNGPLPAPPPLTRGALRASQVPLRASRRPPTARARRPTSSATPPTPLAPPPLSPPTAEAPPARCARSGRVRPRAHVCGRSRCGAAPPPPPRLPTPAPVSPSAHPTPLDSLPQVSMPTRRHHRAPAVGRACGPGASVTSVTAVTAAARACQPPARAPARAAVRAACAGRART
jgi:hypothetical protein